MSSQPAVEQIADLVGVTEVPELMEGI